MARGRGTGASSATSSSACSSPSAGVRSPEARRSRTVPLEKATIRSPRTSPARGTGPAEVRKLASRMARSYFRLGRHPRRPVFENNGAVDAGAIETASAATTASYRSFADATRSVLDLLEQQLPDVTLFLSHLDRGHNVHRIVDTRGGESFGLHANQATPLRDSYCGQMAEDMGPRRCDDLAMHPLYASLDLQQQIAAVSYLGVPLELSDRSRVGSLAALSRTPGRFREGDEQLFAVLARVLSSELERESSTRDLQRMSETLRDHARGLAALGRVTRALAGSRDARPAVCRAACEVASAPVAFVLEPAGREFVSTAMVGVDIAPVTIQPRPESEYGGRAFTSRQSYFVADARDHPALAAPLVEATGARSALFEPVLRGDQIAGVLILIWRHSVDAVPDAVAEMLGVLASQAAVAIEREELRSRVGADGRGDRPRPPQRLQHAAGGAGGRPPRQGVLLVLARTAAGGRHARPPRGRRVRPDPARLRARRGVRGARAGAQRHPARPDRVRGGRAVGRRGARGPAARALHGRAGRRQGGGPRHDDRRRLEGSEPLAQLGVGALGIGVRPAPAHAGLDREGRLPVVLHGLDVEPDERDPLVLLDDGRGAVGGDGDLGGEHGKGAARVLAQAGEGVAAEGEGEVDRGGPAAHRGRDRDRMRRAGRGGEDRDGAVGPGGEVHRGRRVRRWGCRAVRRDYRRPATWR